MNQTSCDNSLMSEPARKAGQQNRALSVEEIAQIVDRPRRSVLRQAERENWLFETVPVRGGRQKLFALNNLPPDIKKMVRIHFGEIPAELAECVPVGFDAARIALCAQKWNAARPWQRRLAQNRKEILETLERFQAQQGMRRAAVDQFVELFRAHEVPGLDPAMYDAISRMSKSQLYAWKKDYETRGIVGLMADYGKTRGETSVPVEQQKFLRALLTDKPHLRPSKLVRSVQARFNGTAAGAKAIQKFVRNTRQLDPAAFAFCESPDAYKSKFQPALGNASEKAHYFLHYIEMDSSPMDVMCDDNKRYTIIGACDIFSRKLKFQVCKTSNSWGIAGLMRRIATEWGIPEHVVRDNGQDYASRMVNDALCALGITVCATRPFSPEEKPHIERSFGTMTNDLAEILPGYIGHSVANRKLIESRISFADRFSKDKQVIQCGLAPTALQEALDGWTDQVYHQRPHSGIAGASPNAKAASVPTRPRRIEDPRVLDILLAPAGERKVAKKGIQYECGKYWSDDLIDWLGRDVLVRADVWDAGRVWCFDLQDMHFICEALDIALSGMTAGDFIAAKKRANKRIKEKVRAMKALAKEVGDPLAEEIESIRKKGGTITNLLVGEPIKGNPFVDAAMAAVARRDEREAEEAQQPPTFPDAQAMAFNAPPEPLGPKVVRFVRQQDLVEDEVQFNTARERLLYYQVEQRSRPLTKREIRLLLNVIDEWWDYADQFEGTWDEADRRWLREIAPNHFPQYGQEEIR